jgi:hypothetical protein
VKRAESKINETTTALFVAAAATLAWPSLRFPLARRLSRVRTPSRRCRASSALPAAMSNSAERIHRRHPLAICGAHARNVDELLDAQTTTPSINGGVPIDGTNLYSAPFFVPGSPSTWIAGFDTTTGITLNNPGDAAGRSLGGSRRGSRQPAATQNGSASRRRSGAASQHATIEGTALTRRRHFGRSRRSSSSRAAGNTCK